WAPDEWLGDAHVLPLVPGADAAAGGLIDTLAPAVSRSCPSVTTCSPASRPPASTVRSPAGRDTRTSRISVVRSGFTTNTYDPCCPVTTALDGTTSASASTYSSSAAFTNCPGQSAPSLLSKLPLSKRVPVAESTALS